MKEGDLVAGRYRLLRPIGAGAMATVWAARHELLERDFALKLATGRALRAPDARARFLREARTVAKLRHPNIVDVADVGEASPGGDLFIAMELLDGASLAEHLGERAKLRPHEALAIGAAVARGLAVAHAAGVVHRDVKPENVFLARATTGGIVPKLLDFGVSKARDDAQYATRSGQLFGTPAYMSPEQALGETDIDAQTDIWSLGVVLYEILTGRHPFEAPSYQALLPKIAETPHPPMGPEVPEPICRVVDRCLAKARGDRYPSASSLAEALEKTLDGLERADDGGSLRVEETRGIPSLPPASAGVARPRATQGTLSPSIHAVRTHAGGRRVLGLVAAALALMAIVVAVVTLVRPAPESSSARAPDVATAASAPPSAASAAAPSVPAPPVSADLPSAPEPATTPVRPAAAAPRRVPAARPVTRVNSAGF